jgi:hypothetical protein
MAQMPSAQGSTVLPLQVSTGAAGFSLINGTQTILSWTAPNDGQLHRVLVGLSQHVTVAETGGTVTLTYTYPDGQAQTRTPYPGGSGTGSSTQGPFYERVQAGTTVSIQQTTALTLGTAVIWAEIQGS